MKKKLVSSLLCAGMAVTAIAGTGLSVQADDGYTFAMLVPTMNHEYFENCVEFANKCAEEFNCTVNVYNADNNADTMSKNVEDAIAAGVDGILIDPYYASGTKCAEMCEAAEIPMIAFDSDIEEFNPQDINSISALSGQMMQMPDTTWHVICLITLHRMKTVHYM